MNNTGRSERFEPRMPFLRAPTSIDKEIELDEDVGPDEPDLALDTPKKKIDELNVSQQQTAAKVTSLQTAQQELQRRQSSFQGARWYSDSTILTYPTAAAKKPPAVASPGHTSAARAQDGNVGRRNDGEPLSLVPPGR
jgi:hypothetical protein